MIVSLAWVVMVNVSKKDKIHGLLVVPANLGTNPQVSKHQIKKPPEVAVFFMARKPIHIKFACGGRYNLLDLAQPVITHKYQVLEQG
ncbi:hypothetical protein SAMN05216333_105106 [Nitrosomonas oligotropha]|uniref:Uncharacterized protein n=1 Tax=Nitrosomonas oligotropha TaxID=42354 RepID=A0A1H8MIQ5_9PROT|nr:hypothetical protein SAMN05216300_10544 [Nitrosomonas oligotropha]SEO17160.1 hypothetical protein SAMN05216333_105106 [Nitrosomonas oligotropha]